MKINRRQLKVVDFICTKNLVRERVFVFIIDKLFQ